ncbi:MAG TPA: hypothetical protein VLL98_02710 [Rickettsiales bacterium]|nr:hypothetical protein [Rickettsiales bacterium]
MKKYIQSFLFAPIFVTMSCLLFTNIIYIFFPHLIPQITDDFQLIDILTISSYGLLFVTLIIFYKDFKNKLDYSIYIFLTLAALLRELGIQHWLTSTDTTAIKMRFFTNPNNPLHEKIISALVILAVLIPLLYLAKKFAIYLVKTFLKFNPVSWSIGTFFTFLICGEFVDRFPSNYRKSFDIPLDLTVKNNLEVLEESSEIFLALIIIIAIVQYHLIHKKR